jgi:hypothetical protein
MAERRYENPVIFPTPSKSSKSKIVTTKPA